MGMKVYKHDTEIFNPDTGEITYDTKYSVTAVNNEEDYIKVYRYLNTVFAFKGINKKLIPTLMEICNYMTFADKGQEVILIKQIKEKISEALGLGVPEIDKHIRALKKADVLRPIGRAVYTVNPFIIGRGKWSDIKELRAQFDYNSGLITAQSIVKDKITGETMAKITHEVKKNMQMPGQMTLFDNQDKTIEEEDRYTFDQIKQLFDYNSMLSDYPDRKQDIDAVMNVLHTAMNTTKQTIRISGQDKQTMAVIRKLMYLDKESVMYALDKFSEQKERIKNPSSYLLTNLYNAPEHYYLDKKNQENNKMSKESNREEGNKQNFNNKNFLNKYNDFPQRTYDFEKLEENLLKRDTSEYSQEDIEKFLKEHNN